MNPIISTIIFTAIFAIPSLAAVTYTLVNDKRNVRKLKATRQKLNDRLEETGSPVRYYPKYSDWEWSVQYDESPEENAINYMERVITAYEDYLKNGGDPGRINDVEDCFRLS